MKPEEEKRRELVNKLKRQGEHLKAKAIESAIGCRFEKGILYLEHPQPILTNVSARLLIDSQHKPKLDAVVHQLGIKVEVV